MNGDVIIISMTYSIIALILGISLGFYISARVLRRGKREGLIGRGVEEKRENKLKILEELHVRKSQGKEARITNDEAQAMLGVSHATAERYLDELEKGGLLRQVGEIGRGVYYKLIK